MSKIEELIKQLCPDGVEYKKICELVDFEQPTKYIVKNPHYNNLNKIPVLTAGQTFILGYTNEDFGIYESTKEKPVIIFDDFTAGFHWVNFNFKIKSSAMKIIIPKQNVNFRYVFHLMGMLNFFSKEHTRLWISTYSQILVPVPPMEIQNEIVKILDNFTELTAELTAELTTRRKQYEFYREDLLTFEDEIIKWTTLDNISKYTNGIGHENDVSVEGKYILINSKFISTDGIIKKQTNKQYCLIYKNEIALVLSDLPNGKALAKCFYVEEDNKYSVNQRICRISNIDKQLLPKFIYYYINRNKYFLQKDNGVDQTNLSKDYVLKCPIPILPLEKQKEIVEKLDKFNTLLTDISTGLPAEMEARQKQYEYYREKLLTFKRKT